MCMAALRDSETQKKGAVIIVHGVGTEGSTNQKQFDPILEWNRMKMGRSVLPLNFAGHHVCSSPSSFLGLFNANVIKYIGAVAIARTRFHEGMP